MIDMNERLITLPQAARKIPGQGDRPRVHVSSIYRWSTKGVGGVVLETIKVGGRRMTSLEALERFIQAQNLDTEQPAERPGDRQRQLDAVDAELDRRLRR